MTLPGKLVDGTFTFLFLNPGDASGHFLSRGDAERKVLAMSCDVRPPKRCESSKIKVDGDMTVLASFRGCPLGDNTVEKESIPSGRPAAGIQQAGSTRVGRWTILEWKDLTGYPGTSVHLPGRAMV